MIILLIRLKLLLWQKNLRWNHDKTQKGRMQMYFFVVTSKTLCPPKKGEKRNIKGTIEALLGCKCSWKSNLVLFCGFRLFAECVFEMLLCEDVRLSFEVKCICVGGVPVCVSCQSACLAPGWGKAPCGMEAGEECASWGEPPKPQSDKLTAGMFGSSYSLTSTPFFLDSHCYHIHYLFSLILFLSHLKPSGGCSDIHTLRDSYCDTRQTITLLPRDGRIYCNLFWNCMLPRLGWCHLVEIGFLCPLKAHRPFGDWSSSGTNELSVRVTWKTKYTIKQNWFLKGQSDHFIFVAFEMEYGKSRFISMLGRWEHRNHPNAPSEWSDLGSLQLV